MTEGTLKIGSFSRIPIKVHWTFGVMILFVSYSIFTSDQKMEENLATLAFLGALFLCVILHEYGHALTARRFGVVTRDIILSPIGGVARMESMPEKPFHEFVIALAGPLVNFIIGLGFAIYLFVFTDHIFPEVVDFHFNETGEFIRYITLMNFLLFGFNLIPAFPMDGGRILRAILSARLGRILGTKVATFIGRLIAVLFIIMGIFLAEIVLGLIGLFIFMMAGKEYDQARITMLLGKTTAAEIMRTAFTRLHLSDTYSMVIEKYYREGEQNFLVFDSLGNLSGTVPELFIKDIIKHNTPDKTVNQLMSGKAVTVSPSQSLKEVIELMKNEGIAIVAVGDDQHIMGILDRNGIENFIRIKSE